MERWGCCSGGSDRQKWWFFGGRVLVLAVVGVFLVCLALKRRETKGSFGGVSPDSGREEERKEMDVSVVLSLIWNGWPGRLFRWISPGEKSNTTPGSYCDGGGNELCLFTQASMNLSENAKSK